MTIVREFVSNFTKIKRTPIVLLNILTPIVITASYFAYYVSGGYHIISDVRIFFIFLQICYPIYVSIVVPILIGLDRNISSIQNTLGLVESRISVFFGKVIFLIFLSAINIILFELCFYIGVNLIPGISIPHQSSYFIIFLIFVSGNLFIYILHVPVAFKFGSSISVLLGISGTILAGYFENAIGDKIWPLIPWEWNVRFLKSYFESSSEQIFTGIISLIIITSIALVLSLLWINKWEGKVIQE